MTAFQLQVKHQCHTYLCLQTHAQFSKEELNQGTIYDALKTPI